MRLVVSTALGLVAAVILFWIMDTLISGSSKLTRSEDSAVRLDFIKVDQDELENVKKRTPPPEPEPPKKPPPPPKMTVNESDRPTQDMPQSG